MTSDLLVWVAVVIVLGALLVAVLNYLGAPRILTGLAVLVTVAIVLIRVLDKMGIYHWHGLSK
jgi:hypothetical protein